MLKRRLLYPWHDGVPRFKDPTYGRIDRDIQWIVDDMKPSTLGQRTAIENSIQQARREIG